MCACLQLTCRSYEAIELNYTVLTYTNAAAVCADIPLPFVCPLQQQITLFNEEDFIFPLGGPEPDNLVDNVELRAVNLNQLPALEGQGISMTLVNLGPCAINLPHIHPRATEVNKLSRY